MPFKVNQDRRHYIPRQPRKVTNWADYDAALTSTRRSWRKLHIGVDADTGQIMAMELTTSDIDGGSRVGPLLDQVAGQIASFTTGIMSAPLLPSVIRTPRVVVPSRATAVPSDIANTAPT